MRRSFLTYRWCCWCGGIEEQCEEERVDDLLARTTRLKAMARFLGLLAFSPHWATTEAIQAYE